MSSKNPTPALRPSEKNAAAGQRAAALEILRPHNCAITFASVLLGGWLGIRSLPPALLLAALSAALITGFGNVFNDLCDIRVDRVNRPTRPLPSGRLSVRAAFGLSVGLAGAGLGLALGLPPTALAIAAGATGGLLLYNRKLKRVPGAGNLTVALLGGLAFLYGGAAVRAVRPAVVPAVFAILFHFGREVLKDVEDREGDRLAGGSTLPLRWGTARALSLVAATYLLLILLTPLPVWLGDYGSRYLFLVLLLDALLVYVLLALSRGPDARRLRTLSRVLKAGMVLGLCAIFLDRI